MRRSVPYNGYGWPASGMMSCITDDDARSWFRNSFLIGFKGFSMESLMLLVVSEVSRDEYERCVSAETPPNIINKIYNAGRPAVFSNFIIIGLF